MDEPILKCYISLSDPVRFLDVNLFICVFCIGLVSFQFSRIQRTKKTRNQYQRIVIRKENML